MIAGEVDGIRPNRLRGLLLNIFWEINDHRARSTGRRNVKRLLHHTRDFANVGDEIAVLHDAQCHAVKIRFLKRAFADHRLRHLAGEHDQRHAVHPRISHAGDEVGGAGPTGTHAHAGLAGGAPVAARGKRAALFVPRQVRANLAGLRQRLMQLHTRAAGVGENAVHPLAFQRGYENFAALHRLAELAARGFAFGVLRFSFCFAH